MRVFSFNRGIGWASSGVEYAQSYRNRIFEKLGVDGKFIFTDMFRLENIEHYTANLGFRDENVIWLYGAFTDIPTSPCSVPVEELEASFAEPVAERMKLDGGIRFIFSGRNTFVNVYCSSRDSRYVQRAETVVGGFLLRTDYYTCAKTFSEFYAPENGKAKLYMRRFYHRDGSAAYEEFVSSGLGVNEDGAGSLFRFPDQLIDGKERLIAFLVKRLDLRRGDLLLIDRATEIGRAVMDAHGRAHVAAVIHAEHFNEASTTDDDILWNNYDEYTFSLAGKGVWYIASTEEQRRILTEQMERYYGITPKVYAIPVGSLDRLRGEGRTAAASEKRPGKADNGASDDVEGSGVSETRPDGMSPRRPFSLITASRLASEKHIDWIVRAAVKAHQILPELTLDVYGEGGEAGKLRELIRETASGKYIRMMGHQDLTSVYQNYEVYISASGSEGFGLTLMEAVGSGLGMIGFDVRYGNITFIDDGVNGLLLPSMRTEDPGRHADALAEAVVRIFTEMDAAKMHTRSYEIAGNFLEENVAGKWKALLMDVEMEADNAAERRKTAGAAAAGTGTDSAGGAQ